MNRTTIMALFAFPPPCNDAYENARLNIKDRPMAEPTAAQTFRSFCATQYGVIDPSHLPDRQRLEAEDAFMAGVQFGFYSGWAALDEEAITLDAEIRAFGARIVDRYREAGLPLGQRRT